MFALSHKPAKRDGGIEMPSPFIPVPLVLMWELRFLLNGQRCELTGHNNYATSSFEAAVATLGPLIKEDLVDNLVPNLSNDLQFTGIHFTDLNAVDAGVGDYTTGFPVPGALATDSLPNGTALVITSRTARRGRSFRGRTYLAGIPTTGSVNSSFTSGLVAGFVAIFNTYLADAITENLPPVVVSKRANGAPRTVGIATPITTYDNVSLGTRSQRRRNPGIGT